MKCTCVMRCLFHRFVLRECEAGRTPNPDMLCNQHIKFGHLLSECQTRLGAQYLATGHYARLRRTAAGTGPPQARLGPMPYP